MVYSVIYGAIQSAASTEQQRHHATEKRTSITISNHTSRAERASILWSESYDSTLKSEDLDGTNGSVGTTTSSTIDNSSSSSSHGSSHGSISSSSSSSSSSPSSSSSVLVSFGEVRIRDYERIVGDHPDVKKGPPLSIGWGFLEREPLAVDDFEKTRHRHRRRRDKAESSALTATATPMGKGQQPRFHKTGQERHDILRMEFGFSEQELANAEAEAHRVTSRRLETMNLTKKAERRQEFRESAMRKFKRALSGSKTKL